MTVTRTVTRIRLPWDEWVVLCPLYRTKVVSVVRSPTGGIRKPNARARGFQTSLWGSLSTLCQNKPKSHELVILWCSETLNEQTWPVYQICSCETNLNCSWKHSDGWACWGRHSLPSKFCFVLMKKPRSCLNYLSFVMITSGKGMNSRMIFKNSCSSPISSGHVPKY